MTIDSRNAAKASRHYSANLSPLSLHYFCSLLSRYGIGPNCTGERTKTATFLQDSRIRNAYIGNQAEIPIHLLFGFVLEFIAAFNTEHHPPCKALLSLRHAQRSEAQPVSHVQKPMQAAYLDCERYHHHSHLS